MSTQIDCPSGKVRYTSVDQARRVALLFDHNNRQRAYACFECGGAHLTSKEHKHRVWMTEWSMSKEESEE